MARLSQTYFGSPAQAGFRLPPEWAPHAATWLSWPRPEGISFPYGFQGIPEAFAALVTAITQWEPVILNASAAAEVEVRRHLTRAGARMDRVRLAPIPADEPWCRDHGPTFLLRNTRSPLRKLAIDWEFNAWGGKYAPWEADNAVAHRAAQFLGVPSHHVDLVAEGGALEVNGQGDLLTTRGCLDADTRNPQLNQSQIEAILRNTLGVERIHWLTGDLIGDDTDGHIDQLARFIDSRTILTSAPHPDDPNAASFRSLREQLMALRDRDRRPFRIVDVPLPRRVERQGERLPACYANFIFVNGAVLVPTFRCPEDRRALARFRELFPDRAVVPVDASRMIEGLGALHCLTQQEPL